MADVSLTGGTEPVVLSRVLHVPKIRDNLISVAGLCDDGHRVVFDSTGCAVTKSGKVVGRGYRKGGEYITVLNSAVMERAMPARVSEDDVLELWHRRLAHADRNALRNMAAKNIARGMDMNPRKVGPECERCMEGKMTDGPMRSRTQLVTVPGTVVHRT